MGTSTDGQICFGIMLEEGAELPWQHDDYDYDEDYWWRVVSGYKGKEYGEEGAYEEISAWMEANPCPVALVNYCSMDCEMFILAVPATVMNASRGYPESFAPEGLTATQFEINALCDFCEEYNIETDEEVPKWWLSSYWG